MGDLWARLRCLTGFHYFRVTGLTQYTRTPRRIVKCARCGEKGVLI